MYVLYFGLISEILQKFTTLKRTIFHATFQEKKSISDSQQFHTNVEDRCFLCLKVFNSDFYMFSRDRNAQVAYVEK